MPIASDCRLSNLAIGNRLLVIECMEQRLQKLIAAAGVASRRHAEELIAAGKVTVNGEVIKELGSKADPDKDHIKVNGKLINPQLKSREKVYVLLNKPKGYLSSVSDPEGRPLVTELLPPSLGRASSSRTSRLQHRRTSAAHQ